MIASAPHEASLARSPRSIPLLYWHSVLVFSAPIAATRESGTLSEIFLSLVPSLAGSLVVDNKNRGIIHNRVSESWQSVSHFRSASNVLHR